MMLVSRERGKNERGSSRGAAAFLVESMLLLVFLAVAMAVFVQVFGLSLAHSDKGEDLSRAISAASSVAEQFAADPAKAEGATEIEGMHVTCEVEKEPQEHGVLYHASISVFDYEDAAYGEDPSDPAYTITASRYVGEVER